MEPYWRAIKASNTSYRKACYKVGARVNGWCMYKISYAEFQHIAKLVSERCRQLGHPEKARWVEHLKRSARPLEYMHYEADGYASNARIIKTWQVYIVIPDIDYDDKKEYRRIPRFKCFTPDGEYREKIERMISWGKKLQKGA